MDALGFVSALEGGNFLDKLHDALIEVSEEVASTGNKGRVGITFQVAPAVKGEPTVTINATISRFPPSDEPTGAFFYAVNGQFSKDDPRQASMSFRDVSHEAASERTVGKQDSSVRGG